jgi:GT2 family glycosyltransferase
MAEHLFQPFVLTAGVLPGAGATYLVCEGAAAVDPREGLVRFGLAGSLRLSTYFNSCSVERWRATTNIGAVGLRLEGRGTFEVDVVAVGARHRTRVAATHRVELTGGALTLPVETTGDDVVLYPLLRCLSADGVLTGGGYVTDAAPLRDVRLAVSVTTFRREAYVRRLLEALGDAAKDDHVRWSDIHVVVVDNAAELDLAVPGDLQVTVVPSRNLGGAGGFARGLLHVRREGWATHVAFMDDDITVEPASVARAHEWLSRAVDPTACLAGSMLREEDPTLLFECGAGFDARHLHPFRGRGIDREMAVPFELADNELDPSPVDFGGWWFFAFPVDLTADYPFPLFLRGDDALFSLLYAKGRVQTMNGVAVWHQDFDYKNGPASFFYEARNLPLVSLLSDPRYGRSHLVRRVVHHVLRAAASMKYDSAERMLMGLEQFLAGSGRWEHIDHEARHAEVAQYTGERLGPLDEATATTDGYGPRRERRDAVRNLLGWVTLGGHLLPAAANRRGPVALKVQDREPAAAVGRHSLVYRYAVTGEGFVTTRDTRRFWRIAARLVKDVALVVLRFGRVARGFRRRYADLASESYWSRQFDEAAP